MDKKETLVLGVDDAGRGPLIGSMFLSGVLVPAKMESFLKSEGVQDSKLLSQGQRVKLSGIIRDHSISHKVIETSADEIDHSLSKKVNLNTLEAIKAAKIINELIANQPEKIKVIVDCPSVNTVAWKATLMQYIRSHDRIELICEHKADFKYPAVAAASILAKVAREESLLPLKKQYGNFGSGYPSDPVTKSFLKSHGKKLKNSGIFRKSWQTWKKLYPESTQQTLL